MSYREIRNFTEILKSLGYPRLISMENFRKPNFELVADILLWMVKLYDPTATITDSVEFENERVEFLTSIASLMAAKARLKLNTKKLYASDGKAVQELLKFATLLFKASRASSKSLAEELIPPPIKIQDVKVARTLASEITQSGAKLYDMLQIEITEKAERLRVLEFLSKESITSEGSRDHDYIVKCVEDIIKNTKQSKDDIKKESEELDADQKNLESKIKKKQEELERTEKRLRRVETERPQFMDEVEKLEKELEYHYDIYMEKYRNLDYIEQELEKFHKAEDERREEQEKRLQKMRERLYREEVELLRHGGAGQASENVHPNA
jgi:clusterin-associated protein 1